MQIAIVKYNAGNVVSVTNTLNRLGVEPLYTDDPELLRKADKVIFPGVGEASTAMNYLRERKLDKVLCDLHQPFLGICLGLQLMCKHTEENDTQCLGIFDLEVKKFKATKKVPQIGWNLLYNLDSPLFDNMPQSPYIYFVHSFFAEVGSETVATADYSDTFSAALHKDNYYAVQGHPEKSSQTGQKILENFLSL